GGFLFYAAIFVAIGSAVDNVQDASQFTGIAMFPIIAGLIISMSIANDPNGSLAFWSSMIPFTSPMVMMSRVAYNVPAWEIIVSLVVLFVSILVMIWMAAKIYRVGIFMYGKKPTIKEIVRWMKYK
ncbi:MAG: ABC transporter permease, partial [Muribaculaceae bacterium]|nr:ABC transporter permease [Muribaculaceae bacterium]